MLSVFAGGERGASNVFTAIASTVTKRDADGAWGLTGCMKAGNSTDWPFTVTFTTEALSRWAM